MGITRCTYGTIPKCIQNFRRKREAKGPLGRPRRRWENNIKMNLRKVDRDARNWIDIVQDGGLV